MNSSFGARLRQRREQQHVTIDAIAAETKISPSLLVALERDDVSHWPTGIFRRAYLRAYARAIMLDPDVVLGEFLALYPDSVEVLPAGAAMWPAPGHDRENPPPATRLGWIVTSARAAVPAILRRTQKIEPAKGITPVNPARPVPPEPTRVAVRCEAQVTLSAAARLCTTLGRASDRREIAPALEEAARLVNAVGLIVWFSDLLGTALTPSFVHGYSDAVRARLTSVAADSDNAVAAAFRATGPRIVDGDGATGAIVVPLIGRLGCVGVLAVEVRDGEERRESIRELATILAAQLVTISPALRLDEVSRRSSA